jgi:hypothetical protein
LTCNTRNTTRSHHHQVELPGQGYIRHQTGRRPHAGIQGPVGRTVAQNRMSGYEVGASDKQSAAVFQRGGDRWTGGGPSDRCGTLGPAQALIGQQVDTVGASLQSGNRQAGGCRDRGQAARLVEIQTGRAGPNQAAGEKGRPDQIRIGGVDLHGDQTAGSYLGGGLEAGQTGGGQQNRDQRADAGRELVGGVVEFLQEGDVHVGILCRRGHVGLESAAGRFGTRC